MCILFKQLKFVINYSQLKCAHLFENILTILWEPRCFSTRRLRIKQRSSLVDATIMTKLQFIRMKTEPVSIADEERRHLVKMLRE